ncbi:S41 family peptidase [Luteolibacter sp. Populi]|uniref:S41 family peptidase n=1 Tax=Luteolibacter sp. Populi TaxID=3230487 RepID=UPI0034655D56
MPSRKPATSHQPKTKTSRRNAKSDKPAPWVKKLGVAVRPHFAKATSLSTFLDSTGKLTLEQGKTIVKQALLLVEQNYAHLPLKRAMHSIDPVQRLKLLLQSLDLSQAAAFIETEFHLELTEIFTSLRDLHTNYLLPSPFNEMTAVLPFAVEDYYEAGQRKYIASHIATGFSHPSFVKGVELTHWNGVPIERAVWNNAQRYAGSNREARHARGVQTLTARALIIAPPPDELWVIVGYITSAGKPAEFRFDWQTNPPFPSGNEPTAAKGLAAASMGIDLEQDIVRRMRLALFAPRTISEAKKVSGKAARAALRAPQGMGAVNYDSIYPQVFSAREVTTPAGTFGCIRIWTFDHWPPEEFVGEFIRLIELLPREGLIVDVRGNGGGVIHNGELILQTLTPHHIEPETLQFLNSPLNREICQKNGPASGWADLSAWVGSIDQALKTGAAFSAGFPITDPVKCNDIAQRYFGPVILITDALCYSTTDIFAAGFQDHKIGPILGTDGNTGAGGANVWEQKYFVSDILPAGVYEELPNGAGMRVAIRRTLRVGPNAGTPLEDLGVEPSHRHFLTRKDLLSENADLMNAAGALLKAQPLRKFAAIVEKKAGGNSTLKMQTKGITRLDIYINERPVTSLDVNSASTSFAMPAGKTPIQKIEIRGFDGSELVARVKM